MAPTLTLFSETDADPESETLERKQSWNDDCLKTLAAFANTRGGVLWIGIHDDGHTTGWGGDGREQERIAHQITDGLHWLPVTMTIQERDGLSVLRIHMAKAASPVAFRGRYYRRVGNSTREIPDAELPRFLLERTGGTWDELQSEFGLSTVSNKTMADFRILARERLPQIAPSDTTADILSQLGLLTTDGNLKRAGMLLFGHNPQLMTRTASVQIARLSNDVTFLDEQVISGNLFAQLEQTMQAIRGYVFVRYDIPKAAVGDSPLRDLQRHEVWEFPYDAVREAVLNALIHRDYMSPGSIQIRVYGDRIVISNPGGLLDALTISDLFQRHNSFRRNPAIAQTVYYTGLIEQWGTGTLRMQDACKREGAPPPEFESRPLEFTVTLRKGKAQNSELPASRVLALASSRPAAGLSRADVMELLQCDAQTAYSILLRLKRRGRLVQTGTRRWARYYVPNP